MWRERIWRLAGRVSRLPLLIALLVVGTSSSFQIQRSSPQYHHVNNCDSKVRESCRRQRNGAVRFAIDRSKDEEGNEDLFFLSSPSDTTKSVSALEGAKSSPADIRTFKMNTTSFDLSSTEQWFSSRTNDWSSSADKWLASIGSADLDWQSIRQQVLDEMKEFKDCASIIYDALVLPFTNATFAVQEIVNVCDELDLNTARRARISSDDGFRVMDAVNARQRTLEFRRYRLLADLLKNDYKSYVSTATFLCPSRISRSQLPNVQDVQYTESSQQPVTTSGTAVEDDIPLVADCELEAVQYSESPLDALLLRIFRNLVQANTGGITSEKDGIIGLLDQGRQFMVLPDQTAEAQHRMVYKTLGGLMTPVLPPFYRIFMSGIVPTVGSPWDGKQIGPWFYAPFLTAFVTPTFFNFLVGPSSINRRKDGSYGGLLVEKCKFLQESNCKGLCLNQCKIPAQQFFEQELGLPLTVSPNFVTQECQWSFGEVPLPPEEDPSFPRGCLSGCESRKLIAARSTPGGGGTLCL